MHVELDARRGPCSDIAASGTNQLRLTCATKRRSHGPNSTPFESNWMSGVLLGLAALLVVEVLVLQVLLQVAQRVAERCRRPARRAASARARSWRHDRGGVGATAARRRRRAALSGPSARSAGAARPRPSRACCRARTASAFSGFGAVSRVGAAAIQVGLLGRPLRRRRPIDRAAPSARTGSASWSAAAAADRLRRRRTRRRRRAADQRARPRGGR